MDVESIARAMVGVRIGGIPLSWDEALMLAGRVAERVELRPRQTIKEMVESVSPPKRGER